MKITPNVKLATQWVGAGATIVAGHTIIRKGVDHFDIKKPMAALAGTAAVLTGAGIAIGGHSRIDKLAFASGPHAALKTVGMVAAALGVSALVAQGLSGD